MSRGANEVVVAKGKRATMSRRCVTKDMAGEDLLISRLFE